MKGLFAALAAETPEAWQRRKDAQVQQIMQVSPVLHLVTPSPCSGPVLAQAFDEVDEDLEMGTTPVAFPEGQADYAATHADAVRAFVCWPNW